MSPSCEFESLFSNQSPRVWKPVRDYFLLYIQHLPLSAICMRNHFTSDFTTVGLNKAPINHLVWGSSITRLSAKPPHSSTATIKSHYSSDLFVSLCRWIHTRRSPLTSATGSAAVSSSGAGAGHYTLATVIDRISLICQPEINNRVCAVSACEFIR